MWQMTHARRLSDAAGATLYSCLVLGNYIFVVLSSVLQLLTLATFAMSAFPGGNASLKGAFSPRVPMFASLSPD